MVFSAVGQPAAKEVLTLLNWYSESIEETAARSRTDISGGLAEEKAASRLDRHGRNSLRQPEQPTFFQSMTMQVKDFTFVLLFITSVISVVIAVNRENGNWLEPFIIVIITILYAVLGAMRDSWVAAERARIAAETIPDISVIRSGSSISIPADELVRGDLFTFREGDCIPADGRLIFSENLICCETAIGCSDSAAKKADVILDVTAPLSERVNMVYAGCTVISGSGRAIATATGMQTEQGIRSGMLAGDGTASKQRTPIQNSTNELQKPVGVIALIICALIFIIGFSWRYTMQIDAIESLLTALALAVAVFPEVLSPLYTLTRILGVRRMSEKHAIARHSRVMETLADVTVVCADKTGIFTTGQMETARLWTAGGKLFTDVYGNLDNEAVRLLEYAAICSGAKPINGLYAPPPTDTAVLPALEKRQIRKTHLDTRYPCVRSIPFDRSRRIMTTVHKLSGSTLIVAKGAPENILDMCDNADIEKINAVISQFAGEFLRVIAVAVRELNCPPESLSDDALNCHMTFAGLIAMLDPLQERTKDTCALLRRAGVRVVMLTGDHPATAAALASECGIMSDSSEIITGEQIDTMSDDELLNSVRKYSVYARITPHDKQRIINAWCGHDEVIAVTGSSVSDTAALEQADISFASPNADTAAKMSADAVMREGGLSAVAGAIREGRTVCSNIRKCAKYMLQCDICAALMMIPGIIICGTFPLLSVHLLLSALIITGMGAAAICSEPSYGEIMLDQPRMGNHSLFNSLSISSTLFDGIIAAALALCSFFIGNAASAPAGRAMALGTLIIAQTAYAFIVRMPAFGYRPGVRHNPVMMAVGVINALIILITLLLFRPAFMLAPLKFWQWVVMAALGAVPVVITEIIRLLREMNGGTAPEII